MCDSVELCALVTTHMWDESQNYYYYYYLSHSIDRRSIFHIYLHILHSFPIAFVYIIKPKPGKLIPNYFCIIEVVIVA